MNANEHGNDVSEDELPLSVVERLVTYEEDKANGGRVAVDKPIDSGDSEDVACVDLMHRVWPDLGPPSASDEDLHPKVLGDFRLVRELGRGGMGTVFEAEQISMGRHVALKVLPFAALVHENSLQRFRNEVRAAAALNHPHIVPVYSIGEERGVHFYAMQLIRGQTLADMIDELRKASRMAAGSEAPTVDSSVATPTETKRDAQGRVSTAADSKRSAETYRTAARLGIQSAEALQHAHDQGVLHRDIKPSNLMLDREGQIYVTDFGLARIEADAGMTMTGDIVGTLRYMAPEQALAKRVVIDHRADIYSLGATLYELLTLQPAFGETDRSELFKQIAFEDPRRLRKLDSHIPAELETIVLKAMAKNPDDRYQAAQELADDLRAFLEDRPIKARPPTWREQVVKWSRRHRLLVISGCIVLLVLGAGSLVSTLVLLAEQNRTKIAAAKTDAVLNFLVNDLLGAPKMEVQKGRDITVREILQNAEAKAEKSFADQPLVESTIRLAIAQSYRTIGRNSLAVSNARRAVDLRTKSLGPGHHDTIDAVDHFVTCCTFAEKGAGRQLAETTLKATRQLNGSFHADTLAAMGILVRALIDSNLSKVDLAYAQNLCKERWELSCKLRGQDGRAAIGAKYDLALLLNTGGQTDEAITLLQQVANESRQQVGLHDGLTLGALRILANIHESRGQFEEAAKQFEPLLDAHRRYYGMKDRATIHTEITLANQYIKIKKYEDARKLYREGLTSLKQNFSFHDTMAGDLLCTIVGTLMAQGHPEEAVAIVNEFLPPESDAWEAKTQLALQLSTLRFEKLRNGKLAVSLAQSASELTKHKDFQVLFALACAHAETGDFKSAIEWSNKAIALSNDPSVRKQIESHMESFRQKKPWRQE